MKADKGEIGKYYAISGVPAGILLDKEGKVIGFNFPSKEIEKILGKIF